MKKLLCFDMDGTIYLGNKLFDGVKELFIDLERKGYNYVFITNNSSKNVDDYIKKLNNLGIKCTKDNFYTSMDVTINYLLQKKAKTIFPVTTQEFESKLKEHFVLEKDKNKKVDFVVFGFDRSLTYQKLEVATWHVENKVPFIASNPDLRCPMEGKRYIPDCGSMCKLITDATGVEPIYLGKPKPNIILDLIDKYNIRKEEVLVIGDRIYTDIASGYNAGVDTLLVLSGETSLKDVSKSHIKPTYILSSVTKISEILGD